MEVDQHVQRVEKHKLYQNDYRKALLFMKLFTRIPISSTELTTKAIVHAMTSYSPKARYVVGMDAKILQTMQNVLPATMNDLVIKLFF
jgi:endonuclease III